MEDDKTIIMPRGRLNNGENDEDKTLLLRGGLIVSLVDENDKPIKQYHFRQGFTVGRSLDNDIVIQNPEVSRHHCEIKKENGQWYLYDLNSANGVYINKLQLEKKSQLQLPVKIQIGCSGVYVVIQQCGQPPQKTEPSDKRYHPTTINRPSEPSRQPLSEQAVKARLLAEQDTDDMGDYTRMVRRVIHEQRQVQGRKYNKIIWILLGLFVLSLMVVVYQQISLFNARKLAIDMFYDIKALEVHLSQSELMFEKSAELLQRTLDSLANTKMLEEQERIKAEQRKMAAERKRLFLERKRLQAMKTKYLKYVKEAASFRLNFSSGRGYEEELITKVAREFGESELELPADFIEEVRRYIELWRNSGRLQRAIERLVRKNYTPVIVSALGKESLPVYFLYLPLQESNYDTLAIGPETSYGIAKGAWQFLPQTAEEFGLVPGPMANETVYDELDERFDFDKATRAAAKYLKHIYSTEAQASGLLVIASYNYGHSRVRKMIDNMPENPRDRNFWKFIQQYKIPKETYDYVFYIFAAAVIGEDPDYFGFKFSPPLPPHRDVPVPREAGSR